MNLRFRRVDGFGRVTVEIEVKGHEVIRHFAGDEMVLEYQKPILDDGHTEAKKIVELAARYKVNAVELRYLMKSDAAVIDESELLCHVPDEADRAYDEAIPRAEELGVRLELTPPRFRDLAKLATGSPGEGAPPPYRDCGFAGNSMVLSPKGRVFPCCLWHGSDDLGKMETQSFDEVWNSVAYRVLRRELAAGEPSREACQTCLVHRDMQDQRYWRPYPFRR